MNYNDNFVDYLTIRDHPNSKLDYKDLSKELATKQSPDIDSLEQSKIKKYTILGERCSGTNILQQIIDANFNIEYSDEFHHKHFFGFCNYKNYPQTQETLFLCIVRNVHEWLLSLFEKQHNLKFTDNFLEFCTREIHSFDTENREIVQDFNFITGQPYKNIFELRKTKINFLYKILPLHVKHYHFILYENISNSQCQINFCKNISKLFQLEKKTIEFVHINYNAQIFSHTNGMYKKLFTSKKYNIKNTDLVYIDNCIDIQLESSIGYNTDLSKKKLVILQDNDKINHTKNQNEIIIKRNEALKKMIASKNLVSLTQNTNLSVTQVNIKSENLIDLTNFNIINNVRENNFTIDNLINSAKYEDTYDLLNEKNNDIFKQETSSNAFIKSENGLHSNYDLQNISFSKNFKELNDPAAAEKKSNKNYQNKNYQNKKIIRARKIVTKNSTESNQNEITYYKTDNNLQNCFQKVSPATFNKKLISNSEQNIYEIMNTAPNLLNSSSENMQRIYQNNNQNQKENEHNKMINNKKSIKNRRLISMK